jgi:hypothetical protein
MKSLLISIAIVLLALFGISYSIWAYSIVASILWAWFVVPLGLSAISWKYFAGIGLLIRLYTTHFQTDKPKESVTDWNRVVGALFAPWVSLFVGWLITLVLL